VIVQVKSGLGLRCALLLVLLTTLSSWSEPLTTGANASPQSPLQRRDPEEEQRIKMLKEMAKQANKERQQQLEKDTEKLLQLATELKQYVGKSNENVMSLDVVKKAEQIEKLAHSVKEKMKAN
jgi:hypothetical protein